jgi:hypothetical protein
MSPVSVTVPAGAVLRTTNCQDGYSFFSFRTRFLGRHPSRVTGPRLEANQRQRLRASLVGRHSRSGVLRGNCFRVAINVCLCLIGQRRVGVLVDSALLVDPSVRRGRCCSWCLPRPPLPAAFSQSDYPEGSENTFAGHWLGPHQGVCDGPTTVETLCGH